MSLSEQDLEFLGHNHSAAMITVGRDGTPKAARVGVALVDGRLWSSGTADRVRTRRLRRDPRCTLFVYDTGFAWLALETSVTILDGSDAAERNVRLFRVMQDRRTGPLSWYRGELAEDEFVRAMVDEGRLIYEFEVHHTYGLH
jgi:PPOX class probable F420-dependent enzyme